MTGRLRLAAIALSSALLLSGAATLDVVAQRQASMKQMALAAKTISEIFAGKQAFDARVLGRSAAVLRDHSGDTLTAQFPDGSFGEGSEAAGTITTERARFEEIAQRLKTLALAFDKKTQGVTALTPDLRMNGAPVVGGSLLGGRAATSEAALATMPAEHVFHQMLETCGSCHARFRVSRQ